MFFIYGVSAAVDALSGMTVNLVLVDQWAEEFLTDVAKRSWPTLKDFFQFAKTELQKKAGLAHATLTRLELIDEKQTRWIFDPDKNWQQWQCQFPVVVADQAQWLVFQAEASMTIESVTSWMKKSWNSNADLIGDLQKYFSATEAIRVSLRNHRTGAEVRLR